jgi:McrBC 5-methylcytosine restriction system component
MSRQGWDGVTSSYSAGDVVVGSNKLLILPVPSFWGTRLRSITLDWIFACRRLNMNVVFEAYLRTVLQSEAREDRWGIQVLDGNREGGSKFLFSDSSSVVANPDIVMAPSNAANHPALLLIDAKYKPMSGALDREDLNQVISYGLSYNAPNVVLAHPRGRASTEIGHTTIEEDGPLCRR